MSRQILIIHAKHAIKGDLVIIGIRVDSGNLPAGKLPGFTGILRLPLPDFVPKLPEFTVP